MPREITSGDVMLTRPNQDPRITGRAIRMPLQVCFSTTEGGPCACDDSEISARSRVGQPRTAGWTRRPKDEHRGKAHSAPRPRCRLAGRIPAASQGRVSAPVGLRSDDLEDHTSEPEGGWARAHASPWALRRYFSLHVLLEQIRYTMTRSQHSRKRPSTRSSTMPRPPTTS